MILLLIRWGYDMIRKISKVASQLIPRASADDSLARHEDKAIFDSVFYLYKDDGLEHIPLKHFCSGIYIFRLQQLVIHTNRFVLFV